MGDLVSQIKNTTSNKNTVTVLGVIFVIYVAYTIRVNNAVSPISVPYASQQISPGTQITSEYIAYRNVPPGLLKGKVITNANAVLNKYVSPNSIIPEGSLFYESAVIDKDQVENNTTLNYPNGYVLYYMEVNSFSTYGNSIYPGNYIDIYLKAVVKFEAESQYNSDADRVMLDKLLENVKVLAVKDAAGDAVFEDLDNQKTPSMIVFAVPEEYYILLKKSEFLSRYDSTLIPVPTNESLKDTPGELKLATEDIKNWINTVTFWTGE